MREEDCKRTVQRGSLCGSRLTSTVPNSYTQGMKDSSSKCGCKTAGCLCWGKNAWLRSPDGARGPLHFSYFSVHVPRRVAECHGHVGGDIQEAVPPRGPADPLGRTLLWWQCEENRRCPLQSHSKDTRTTFQCPENSLHIQRWSVPLEPSAY